NHRFPSGPSVISRGSDFVLSNLNSSILPLLGSSRPTLSALLSVNQSFLFLSNATAYGSHSSVGTVNSVISPFGVILPILFADISANQIFPSGPVAIARGHDPGVNEFFF